MVSTEFKGVGLHDTAFRDAIREDSRQTTPSRGVTQRKKFAVEANVESRVTMRTEESLKARESNELSGTLVIGAGKVAAFGCPAAQALINHAWP